tara:strand:- start:1418 stop:1678 length:261 start_codon:yes stop_codon:yes gene_type:complete
MIKILMLKEYSLVLIARMEEVGSELGEPDCKLTEPYEIKGEYMEHWPSFSMQREMMIHSDSILTILEPDKAHLDKYQSLTAKNVTE